MKDKFEYFFLFIIAILSITISVLDLTGFLESISFLRERITTISLLVLGFTIGYLALERRSKLDKIEKAVVNGFESTIISLKGGPLYFMHDSKQLFEYIIESMKKAEKSIDDLSIGNMISTRLSIEKNYSFEKYKKSRISAASKKSMQYREIMSYPRDTEIGISRYKRSYEMLQKDIHGYQLKFYDFSHNEIPPYPLFMIIDSKELILGHHRGLMSQEGETYLSIKQPEIVNWFIDYYNAIWSGAKIIKEPGKKYNIDIFEKINN